ncbi:MAG: hypothetical protein AAF310_04230 [Myxococcota bacterium]
MFSTFFSAKKSKISSKGAVTLHCQQAESLWLQTPWQTCLLNITHPVTTTDSFACCIWGMIHHSAGLHSTAKKKAKQRQFSKFFTPKIIHLFSYIFTLLIIKQILVKINSNSIFLPL